MSSGTKINEEIDVRLAALDTPKKRFDYLASRGWQRLSIERTTDQHIICWWQTPDASMVTKQSKALRLEIRKQIRAERQQNERT